jgi:hypothetical protein
VSVYWKDLAERVVSTYLQAFLGSVVVTEMTDKSMWLAAVSAGVAAAASLVKGLAAGHVGLRDSASLSKDV